MKLNKKTLIIFGCGYIGSRAAEHALRSGMTVTAITRNPDRASALSNAGVHKVIIANIEKSDWHPSTEKSYDFVLNCISGGRGSIDSYRSSYIGGMLSIIKWMKGRDADSFVYTSSTGVYPQNDGSNVNESSDTGGSERADILREAETLAEGSPAQKSYILRLCGIYGPDRHYLLDALRSGKKSFPGSGTHLLNLIHADDIVRAIFACFEAENAPGSHTYNLSDGKPATKIEVLEWLALACGKTTPSFDPNAESIRMQTPKNRLIVADKIHKDLGWSPLYPDFRTGYDAILKG